MSKEQLNERLITRFIDQVKSAMDNRDQAKKLVKSIAKRDKELANLTQNVNDDMAKLLDYLKKHNPKTPETAE